MRRTAVVSSLVLVGGLLGPSTASAGGDHDKGHTRWIAVEDQFALVLPNGETLSGEEGGGEEPEGLPPVGAEVFFSEVLYETADGTTRGQEVGRSHIQCTVHVVATTFRCDGTFVFHDGSQLLASVHLDFATEQSGAAFDIAVLGGTGDWFGASGALTLTDTSTEQESSSLYEAKVVFPHR